jgi:hypothetical protein
MPKLCVVALTRAVPAAAALLCDLSARAEDRISQATAIPVPELQEEIGKLYSHEGPLGTVTRQLYVPYPRPNVSSVITTDYEGPAGLRRFEVLTYQVFDDVYQDAERRYSDDNGRTWLPWQPDPEVDITCEGAYSWQRFAPTGPSRGCFDPASGLIVQLFCMVSFDGDPRKIGLRAPNYHRFSRTSADNGRTWSAGRLVRYQDGPDCDRATLRDPAYMNSNAGVYYYNTLPLRGGGVIFGSDQDVVVKLPDGTTASRAGIRCFIGTWDKASREYRWTVSEGASLPRTVSAYLAEPWLAELQSGDLLLDMRGTNAGATDPNAPGRHWYSLSRDQGRTWGPVTDWRYDDGEPFFAPATMGKVLRHSQTGKLYWFGNISPGPTQGNSPRYPFYIAEIEENRPAIRRATRTVIDDRDPTRHTAAVQFSNFYVFENRETHEFEVYLSPYGQYPNVYQASVYKYTVRLK